MLHRAQEKILAAGVAAPAADRQCGKAAAETDGGFRGAETDEDFRNCLEESDFLLGVKKTLSTEFFDDEPEGGEGGEEGVGGEAGEEGEGGEEGEEGGVFMEDNAGEYVFDNSFDSRAADDVVDAADCEVGSFAHPTPKTDSRDD